VLSGSIQAGLTLWGGCLSLSRLGKSYQPLQPTVFHPRRILVIRLDLIGDLVLSTVVVRALKRTYPEAEIDLVATPASAKVLAADPDLAHIYGYDPNIWRRPQALVRPQNWRELRTLLQQFHSRDYDLTISIFGKWAGVLAVLSRAHRTLGFGRELAPGLLSDSVPGQHWTRGEHRHEVDYCLDLAQAAGATITAEDRYPQLAVPESAQNEVDILLKSKGVVPGQQVIACHVSANNGQSKRWPVPYWATLMDSLISEDHAQIVLTGAPNDLPLIEKITSRMHEQPIVLAGKTSLTQLAALLKRADLLISGDSGPMHMASAVATPLIAIHGPTNPELSGPVSKQATILRSDIWCSPCYEARDTADCRFFTTQCMKNIQPAQVLSVVRTTLGDKS
jgi:lipopolysaccharide heptosyltransferase II